MKYHRIPVGPFATNCILIEDEETRDAVIVDPGGDGDTLVDRIETLKIRPVRILLTHGHMDHCLDTTRMAREFEIPVMIHKEDLPLYENLGKQVEALMGPAALASFIPDKLVEPTGFFEEGSTVEFGKTKAEVIHLPGHTPGGVGFLFRQEPDVLVCGDTIFRDGVGRTDLWGGSWEKLLQSIREKIFALNGNTVLVTGHGADTTVDREKGSFPY